MIQVYQEWEIVKELQQKHEEKCTYSYIAPRRIGLLIQEARIQKRITVSSLAEMLNVEAREIVMFENGTETPTPKMCEELEKTLEVSFPLKS